MLRFIFGGDWVIDEIAPLDKSLRTLELDGAAEVELDGSQIQRMDSAGAWIILRTKHELSQRNAKIRALTVPDAYRSLFEKLEREIKEPPPPPLRIVRLRIFLPESAAARWIWPRAPTRCWAFSDALRLKPSRRS